MTLPQLDRDGCEIVSSKFPFLRATLHRRLRRPTIVTDANGGFRIDGIDAGKLKLLFEHPSFGQLEKTVTIDEGAEVNLEVDIADLTASGVKRSFAFPLGGKALFKIDGVVCGQHDFDRLVTFYRARHAPFELGRHWFEVEVLRRAVIPLAAMLASRPQDRLAREAGARRILALLNLGQTFEELAAQFSNEAAPRRGILLENRGRADLDPSLGAAVFETPVGRVSTPFWTTRGLHLVKIVGPPRGRAPTRSEIFETSYWPGKASPIGTVGTARPRIGRRKRGWKSWTPRGQISCQRPIDDESKAFLSLQTPINSVGERAAIAGRPAAKNLRTALT